MSFFRDIQRKAANIHAKKQAEYYKKLRRDTKLANLKKAKLERLHEAKRQKMQAQRELNALKPKRSFRMPKLVGDLKKLTAGMPSDAELNKAVFGTSSPKVPKDIARLEAGPSDADLKKLDRDIFR